MIEIDGITAQTLYKRVGDSVTVNVKLRNTGDVAGTVTLKVDVYEPLNEIWIRISPILGDNITVSPGSTVTKSYSFKPFSPMYLIGYGNVLDIRARISGDSSDEYEDIFRFEYTNAPNVTWHDGRCEFKIIENWPSTCSGSITEKHAFPYGQTVRMMYRAFGFSNNSHVRVLFTMVKEISSDVYWLVWQGISTIKPPDPGYYWSCYLVGWNHTNYPKGIYLAYATAEMVPGYSSRIGILRNYFSIY